MTSILTSSKNDPYVFCSTLHGLSNAVYRFSMRCVVLEISGGAEINPPPAGSRLAQTSAGARVKIGFEAGSRWLIVRHRQPVTPGRRGPPPGLLSGRRVWHRLPPGHVDPGGQTHPRGDGVIHPRGDGETRPTLHRRQRRAREGLTVVLNKPNS